MKSLTLDSSISERDQAIIGVRATWNISRHFSLDGDLGFSPLYPQGFTVWDGGRLIQGQFGVKSGIRRERWGVFAKVRPGFVSFSEAIHDITSTTTKTGPKTYFSLDTGGVLEFYPSPRVNVRFDAGDTMIRYPDASEGIFGFRRGSWSHNLDFSTSIQYRFFRKSTRPLRHETVAARHPRFEAGPVFSFVQVFGSIFQEQAFAVGGRFTWNFSKYVAWDSDLTFTLVGQPSLATTYDGGRMMQLQSGAKAGYRWRRLGVFGKTRPGLMTFSNTITGGTFPFGLTHGRKTFLTLDAGAVFEFYPNQRIVIRYDIGDTLIYYPPTPVSTSVNRARTTHNQQSMFGLQFRF